MSDKPIMDSNECLAVLERWNRWGSGRFKPGQPRGILEDVELFLTSPEIVALIGPRRAGKTTLFHQLMDRLGQPAEACLHVNFEEPGLAPYIRFGLLDRLYQTYRERVYPEGRAFLFLDEIQVVPEWERWVRACNEREDVKIFVTGSSSALMSRELGTLLTGRHVTFKVLPLDFGEFLDFRKIERPSRPDLVTSVPLIAKALEDYLKWGGFPEVVLADHDRRRRLLLEQYFTDVLFKDVALRYQVRDLQQLKALAVHLMTQTASLVSLRRLSQMLEVSLDLIRSYCGYLQEAFLVDFLPCYSLKVSERIRRPQKVYAIDTGLRNAVCLSASPDRGRLMETAVYRALSQEEGELFYWKGKTEVDFLLRRDPRATRLIQVAYQGLEDPKVLEREVRALTEAGDEFPEAARQLVVGDIRGLSKVLPESCETVPFWRWSTREAKDAP